jgi:RecJ-like exonuclease
VRYTDDGREPKRVVISDDDGMDVELPTCWEICSTCDGNGAHSQRLGAITSDEWNNDWDEESRETYLRGGYDATCESCSGSGKVRVVDVERLTAEQLALWEAWQKDEAEYQALCKMERDMGA